MPESKPRKRAILLDASDMLALLRACDHCVIAEWTEVGACA